MQRNAVATSHGAQGNTIEFSYGVPWRVLQEHHDTQWEILNEVHFIPAAQPKFILKLTHLCIAHFISNCSDAWFIFVSEFLVIFNFLKVEDIWPLMIHEGV